MALISLRQLLDHAAANGYGVPAYNITNLETMQAVLEAANQTESPVLMQASRTARAYIGDAMLKQMIKGAVETYPKLPIVMHLDHGNEFNTCFSAMELGFTSVMMDGSLEVDAETPAGYDHNVMVTKSVVELAHARGVSVEGELGIPDSHQRPPRGVEGGEGIAETPEKAPMLTDPDEARAFVDATGVDALAVAVGTSHGAYQFVRQPSGEILVLDRIKALHAALPNTHLVVHGASAIPEDLQEMINANGGDLPATEGVPLEETEAAIKAGLRKINIDTDLRLAMTGALRAFLADNPTCFDVRSMLTPARDRMRDIAIDRNERFGVAGQAGKIRPVPLPQMADSYTAGVLRARSA